MEGVTGLYEELGDGPQKLCLILTHVLGHWCVLTVVCLTFMCPDTVVCLHTIEY